MNLDDDAVALHSAMEAQVARFLDGADDIFNEDSDDGDDEPEKVDQVPAESAKAWLDISERQKEDQHWSQTETNGQSWSTNGGWRGSDMASQRNDGWTETAGSNSWGHDGWWRSSDSATTGANSWGNAAGASSEAHAVNKSAESTYLSRPDSSSIPAPKLLTRSAELYAAPPVAPAATAAATTKSAPDSGLWSSWKPNNAKQASHEEWNDDWKPASQSKPLEPKPPPPPPGPPGPPPGPPPPLAESWKATDSSCSAEVEDVLKALRKLVESHGGMLPGTAFEELYKMKSTYRATVKSGGGPKKFVEAHEDRFNWVLDGVPGGSVVVVEKSTLSKANVAAAKWDTSIESAPQKLPKGFAQKWLQELISEQKDGILLSKVFKEIETWRTPPEAASFKTEILQTWGGLEEFVDRHPKIFSWVPGTADKLARIRAAVAPAAKKESRECCEVLAEVLEWHGSSILAAKVLKQVKDWDPVNFERYKAEVDEAGGVKKYISWYPDRFVCSLAGGPGTETVSVKSDRPPCVDTIAELLEWHGGVLLGSRVLPELHSWRVKEHSACKTEMEEAGGIKKFIQQYPSRFTWVLQEGPGTEAVQLVVEEEEDEETTESHGVLKALEELLEWHGGTLLGSRVFIDLKAWRPETYEKFRKDIGQLGGLKKFASKYPGHLKWVSDADEGKDSISLIKGEPDVESLGDLLTELVEWHDGSLLASKVFKSLKAWDSKVAERFRQEVHDAGSLKKLIQRFPDKLEWVVDNDPGKEVVRLVNAKAAAAKVPAAKVPAAGPVVEKERPAWAKYQ